MANQRVELHVLQSIEADYRAGVLSVRCIASKHRVSEAAVRKWAKNAVDAEGRAAPWTRDLKGRVMERAREILAANPGKSEAHVLAGVRTAHARARTVTQTRTTRQEDEITGLGSRAVVEVVREQRVRLHRVRTLIEQLGDLIGFAAENRDLLQQMVIEETARDPTPRRRRSMLHGISLAAHAGAVRDLATAMQQVIALERQAYGLKPVENPIPAPTPQPMTQEDIDRKFEELRRRFEERLRPS
jgi:hypothetical protein